MAGALVGSTRLEIEITRDIDRDYEYRFNLVNEKFGRYAHHMVTGLDFEVTSVQDCNITFVRDRIEKPGTAADGTFPQSDDYRLSFGLTLDI